MSKLRTRYLWTSIFGLHLLVFSLQIQQGNWQLVDSADYLHAARNLNQEDVLYCDDYSKKPLYLGNYTRRPPVYPLLLSLFNIYQGEFILLALIQMGMSLLSFSIFLSLYKHLYPQSNIPLWMWMFFLIYPAQYIYANLLMAEMLFQLGINCLVWLGIQAFVKKSWKLHLLCGLVLCLAILTKPVLYLLIPLYVGAMLILMWKEKNAKLIFGPLLVLICLSGYLWRNYQLTQYVHVSSVENINLYQFPTSYVIYQEYPEPEASQLIDSLLIHARSLPTFREEQVYLRSVSFGYLFKHIDTWISLHIRGMLNFFLDPGRFDMYNFLGIEKTASTGLMQSFGKNGYAGVWEYLKQQPVAVLALLGVVLLLNSLKCLAFTIFPFSREIGLVEKCWIWGMVAYLACVTGTMGASRFSMPVFFLLMLMLPSALNFLKIRIPYFRIKSQ